MGQVSRADGDRRNRVTARRLGMVGQADAPFHSLLILSAPGTVRIGGTNQVFEGAGHGFIVFPDDARVVVFAVDPVVAEHPGIGPPNVRAAAGTVVRRMIGEPSTRLLGVLDVHQPLVEKGGQVEVIQGRRHEKVHVPGIPAPFIALVAVGRDPHDVRAHRPLDILHEPGQQRVRAGKPRLLFEIRVEHDAGHVLGRRFPGQPMDLHELVTVVGETRFENFHTVALAEITIDLPVALAEVSGTQVIDVDRAVGVQNLTVLQGDLGTGRRLHFQPRPAAEDLSHIDNIDTRPRFGDGDRRQRARLADRFAARPDQFACLQAVASHHDRLPGRCVVVSPVPAG